MKQILYVCAFIAILSCTPEQATPEKKEDCYTCDLVVKINISGPVNESRTQRQFNGIYCGDDVQKAKTAARQTKSENLGYGVRQTIQEHLECELQK